MKFLCICQYGHSRSVCLTRVLHELGHQAVAVGWQTSPLAIPVLSDWADWICTLETAYIRFVPKQFHSKILDFHVGPDIWSNPYNRELHNKLLEIYLKVQRT